ncbi:MAG: DsbA family oxidoreductase [Flavobacteriales bacterium]|nr:DsbA family oxidoreductase [Flavobacteriales bacterium]
MKFIVVALMLPSLVACGQSAPVDQIDRTNIEVESPKEEKMKIEIWSDVVCPFCYIGKREFEKALNQFAEAKNVEIEWKSFQLMPDMPDNYGRTTYQYFAEKYGTSMEEAVSAHEQVTQRAKGLGLTYNFDVAIPANTGMAHQLIHFAKQHGKQDAAEEILFKSYFTDGRNLNDLSTLLEIGATLGLDQDELRKALENGTFADAVNADIIESQELGVRGVPFFVFDRKYAVSGAQDSSQFIAALEQAYAEWQLANQ